MYAYFYFVGDVYSMKTEGASFHASLPPSFHLFKSKLDHMLSTDASYGAVDNPGIRCASGFDILAFLEFRRFITFIFTGDAEIAPALQCERCLGANTLLLPLRHR